MSKDIIKSKDLKTLERLQIFLVNIAVTTEQLEWMRTELKTEQSPCWNGGFTGVGPAMVRIHDIVDAVMGRKTDYHVGGLTTAELFKLATTIGIDREEAETNKKLLWLQISRRLSPTLSRAEAQTILYALLEILTRDEIKWLIKQRPVGWKKYYRGNQDWIKSEAITLTDCSIKIEDILCVMDKNPKFDHYRGRVSRDNLLTLEERLGISPPSQKIWPKGVVKARMLLKIAKEDKLLRKDGAKDSIIQTWGIV